MGTHPRRSDAGRGRIATAALLVVALLTALSSSVPAAVGEDLTPAPTPPVEPVTAVATYPAAVLATFDPDGSCAAGGGAIVGDTDRYVVRRGGVEVMAVSSLRDLQVASGAGQLAVGDVLEMRWDPEEVPDGCVDLPVSLAVKDAASRRFDRDEIQALVPGWDWAPAGSGGPLQVTIPGSQEGGLLDGQCFAQVDSVIGPPLATVGPLPDGSFYSPGSRGDSQRNMLIDAWNGEFGDCRPTVWDLSVTKTVEGPVSGQERFAIEARCEDTAEVFRAQVGAGARATLRAGIGEDVTCDVTEVLPAAPSGATWLEPSFSVGGAAPVPGPVTVGYADAVLAPPAQVPVALVTVANEAAPLRAAISVDKAVVAGPVGERSFEVCLTPVNDLAVSADVDGCETFTWSRPSGADAGSVTPDSVTFDGLPVGSRWLLTETARGSASATDYAVDGGAPGTEPPTVEVDLDGASVSVRNEYWGLTSMCVAPGEGDRHVLRITNPGDATRPYEVRTAGGSVVASGDAAPGDTFVFVPAGTMILWVDGVQGPTKAQNGWPCLYHLTPEKTWDPAPPTDLDGWLLVATSSADDELGFPGDEVRCTWDGTGLDCVDPAHGAGYDLEATLEVAPGGAVTVTETLDGAPFAGWSASVGPLDLDVDLTADGALAAWFAGAKNRPLPVVNEQLLGGLRVTKAVAGDDVRDADVVIDVTCDDGTVDALAVGPSATTGQLDLVGLPAGTECVIDETADGLVDLPGVEVDVTATVDDAPVQLPVTVEIGADATVEVAITNTYTDERVDVSVTKEVFDVRDDLEREVTICLLPSRTARGPVAIIQSLDGSPCVTFTATDGVVTGGSAGATHRFADLPPDDYVVVEVDRDGADLTGYSVDGGEPSFDPPLITPGPEGTEVVVGNEWWGFTSMCVAAVDADAGHVVRIRNPGDAARPFAIERYGDGVVAEGDAGPGDTFVLVPAGTMTLFVAGVEVDTKAQNDRPCVYHLTPEKAWEDADGEPVTDPDVPEGWSLTLTAPADPSVSFPGDEVVCTWTGAALDCADPDTSPAFDDRDGELELVPGGEVTFAERFPDGTGDVWTASIDEQPEGVGVFDDLVAWFDPDDPAKEGSIVVTNRERFLDVATGAPVCDGDVPYLDYEVLAGNLPPGTPELVDITFHHPTDPSLDVTYLDLPLTGRVPWAGAVVDGDGDPVDWPGWTRTPDGTWVEGDEFDWVRPEVDVEFSVNPSRVVSVAYPPSSPECATDPRIGSLSVTKELAGDVDVRDEPVVVGIACDGVAPAALTIAPEEAGPARLLLEGVPAGTECVITEAVGANGVTDAVSAEVVATVEGAEDVDPGAGAVSATVTVVQDTTSDVVVTDTYADVEVGGATTVPQATTSSTVAGATSLPLTGGDPWGLVAAASAAVLAGLGLVVLGVRRRPA